MVVVMVLSPSGLATEVDSGALASASPEAAGCSGSVSPFLDSVSVGLVSV